MTSVPRYFRLLPLPLCIALCLPAWADEKPNNWNLCSIHETLPGFDDAPAIQNKNKLIDPKALPTDIEGDQLTGTEINPEYDGNVTLRRGTQYLHADNLKYSTEDETYIAEGSVRFQDESIRVLAKRAEGDQSTDTHKISDIRYQLISKRGNGEARSIDLQGDFGEMRQSTYTTCDPDQKVWQLRARQIDVDNEEGFGVARNAVVHIGKVPVLYVPLMKFPTDDRRSTGLLFPSVGYSNRNGFDYRQPIYLNLAPNYDATLYPRWMSKRGIMLDNEFRYLYKLGRGEVNVGYMPSDSLRDRDRSQFSYTGFHNINKTWQARARLAWVSDERFTEDFSNRLDTLSASNLLSTVGVYGNTLHWNAGVMADHSQLSDYTLTEASLPFNRKPRAFLNWDQPVLPWLNAGVYAEAVRFEHPDIHVKNADYERTGQVIEVAGGNRYDFKPYLSTPLQGSSWYITPTLAWRYTAYQLEQDKQKSNQERSITRSVPIGSVDMGLFFDRDTKIGGRSYLHTLEPRLFYLNAPYRDQSDIPLFDTRPMTFSWGQLFRDNRYSGADRQADANQITVALTSRLIRQSDGREKLSASFGQIFYLDDSRVTAPGETPIEQGKSAWVADATYAINDRWNIGAAYQWNPKYRRKDLASVRSRYLLKDDGIINVAYRYRYNVLEQADLSFLYPISPSWSVVGRYYHSFLDKKALESIGGVQWDSCCLAVRFLARRHVRNRQGEMDNSFQIEFELKGLGSVGQNTEGTLRRAILGYYRDDLYLVPPSNTSSHPDDYDPNKIP